MHAFLVTPLTDLRVCKLHQLNRDTGTRTADPTNQYSVDDARFIHRSVPPLRDYPSESGV